MEEDLFPSAMSMSTRSELEEERRLFYVALTRAEHQAYLLMRNRVIVGVNSQIVSLRVLLKK
jgi:superfamily I DNA/RNA helicase